MTGLRVGEAARQSGVKQQTIRDVLDRRIDQCSGITEVRITEPHLDIRAALG